MRRDKSLKKVLLLAANPRNTAALRLQEEERVIKEQLRLAGYGEAPIFSSGATRPRDIQQALLDSKPQIIHFSGHGSGAGGLAFEDETGGVKLVSGEALGRLLHIFSNRYPIECVLLNACFSRIQAEEMTPYVDYVVGMSDEIGDRAAVEFTVGFYKSLGAGESYEFSYELGCNAIQLAGIPEHLVPVLMKRGQSDQRDEAAEFVPDQPELSTDELQADWNKLERFLESGWWKEADILTTDIMLKTIGRHGGEWIRDEELEGFPCSTLLKLDRLWIKHSRGLFGFSVQKAIWNALGGLGTHPKADGDMEREFGDRVGWRKQEEWLGYHDYNFNVDAPPGHLPRYLYNHSFGWWLGRSCLICTRLDRCAVEAHKDLDSPGLAQLAALNRKRVVAADWTTIAGVMR